MPGSDAARERAARRRASARTPKGKLAWDKERTRELFRLYKEEGDEEEEVEPFAVRVITMGCSLHHATYSANFSASSSGV